MEKKLLNVGFGNMIVVDRIVAIISPNSSPMRRLKDDARNERHLLDATQGRRTRSFVVLDSNHIVLSAIQYDTLSQRLEDLSKEK